MRWSFQCFRLRWTSLQAIENFENVYGNANGGFFTQICKYAFPSLNTFYFLFFLQVTVLPATVHHPQLFLQTNETRRTALTCISCLVFFSSSQRDAASWRGDNVRGRARGRQRLRRCRRSGTAQGLTFHLHLLLKDPFGFSAPPCKFPRRRQCKFDEE